MSWRGVPVEGLVWLASTLGKVRPVRLNRTPKDIVVIRPSDLGDLLTTTPVFEALRHHFPSSRIIAGVGSWGRQIIDNNPFIDEIVELDAPWNNKVLQSQTWGDIIRFLFRSEQVSRLRKRNGFDIGIDVLGSHVGSILMMRLGVKYRVGVRGYRGGWSACEKYVRFTRNVHVSRASLAQAELLGVTKLPEARPQIYLTELERAEAAQLWNEPQHMNSKRLLVACGGGFEGKCWPPEAFGEALKELSATHDCSEGKLDILLVGGPGDKERASRVMASGPTGMKSLCGKTSLRVTFALAEQSDLVLTNASMMLHAAAAFFRPTVVVLGGIHLDRVDHDRLWGYPPPYVSVGPVGSEKWPSVERVVQAVKAAPGICVEKVAEDTASLNSA